MNSALKVYANETLSMLPPTPICKHTGAKTFLPMKIMSVRSWDGEFVQWSSFVTVLTPAPQRQDPEHPKHPEHWSSGQFANRCDSDSTVFGKQLPLGWIKDQPFSSLSRESRIISPPPPRVNSNRSLVGRHNGWTWEPFKFCFLHWGKEFVLVSELLLEMRTRKAKLGLVIRQVSALS